ncbi:MAG: VPLPA-CTERM sorting domain-containing protein [Neptuniibacter sp.]|uniref:VPLPA-CTERM sorting domain-containing protein n=1 Tax=Neptuniibacter sp. TaxID=1962643 RepID=UPI003B5C6836
MKTIIIFLYAVIGLFSLQAHAATFNFQAIADNQVSLLPDSYSGVGEKGYSAFVAMDDGITVTATGSATNDDDQMQFAYLDKGNAGLGVCKDLTGSAQCSPSSDDNVTAGETLKLSFDSAVTIDSLEMVNGGHGSSFNGVFDLLIDSTTLLDNLTLAALFSTPGWTGHTFEFISQATDSSNSQQFYISTMDVSPVPLPAAAWLFLSGLAGLLGFRMQKKSA